eukprot:4293182-Pyramimonas_sp.AAC.2
MLECRRRLSALGKGEATVLVSQSFGAEGAPPAGAVAFGGPPLGPARALLASGGAPRAAPSPASSRGEPYPLWPRPGRRGQDRICRARLRPAAARGRSLPHPAPS